MRLDLRSPKTVEELVEACVAKVREDAKEDPELIVEISLSTEVMFDMALRLLALESRPAPDHRIAADNRP